jgi:hypothetical protein
MSRSFLFYGRLRRMGQSSSAVAQKEKPNREFSDDYLSNK